LEILDGAVAAGATATRVAERMAISLRTLQRWRRQFAGDGDGGDRRKGSARHVAHRLSDQERQRILTVCNEPPYASLPPAQIVPDLADQGEFLASESSFYRVLHTHQQVQHRGRARPPQEPRPVPRRCADGPNQLWSWDITYLPTSVRGVWLYLYLVMDVWSRKIVAWDVHDREDAELAVKLISRACLRERINKRRQRRLILHADNGSAMRSATLEVRLGGDGRAQVVFQTEVSNDTPIPRRCSAPLIPAGVSQQTFCRQEEACHGRQHSCTGTAMSTATVRSNS